MSTTLIAATAHGLGSVRLGRRFPPGQGRVVDALGKLAGLIGGPCGIAIPWPGVRFEADLTDRIQRQMWAGTYERHVRECFHALLEPGDLYADVGAHVGFHATYAAYRVGQEGSVFAFEADPRIWERLNRNLAQFPWAQAVNAAVWDRSGAVTFERSSTNEESGWGTVSQVRDLDRGEHVNVPAVALDEWFQHRRVVRWDAMKLDAEGSEMAVLRGAQESLQRFRPFLVAEMNSILLQQAGFSPAGMMEFFQARGYRVFRLAFRRLQPWDAARDSDFCEMLCLPEEQAPEMLCRLVDRGFRYGEGL